MINGVSLFANVGIGETYVKEQGFNIKVANELLKDRSEFYEFMHPETEMISGDITDKNVYNEVLVRAKKHKCEFLLATPPCQGMSVAGRKKVGDKRNLLIKYAVSFIMDLSPKYVIIENVPSTLTTYIDVDGEDVLIQDYIVGSLVEKYKCRYKVVDGAHYGTPQHRKRAIFLLAKGNEEWQFPQEQKHITVKDTIGHLPSLESGQDSGIPYHKAKKHNDRHIEIMRHTPEGRSAFDNKIHFPKRKDGEKIRGFKSTYKRMSWNRPAPTITMANGSISSQNNVHPGKPLGNGIYSDARVLTPKELFLLTGLSDDWIPPPEATDSLIRKVIGECLLPRLVNNLLETLPR